MFRSLLLLSFAVLVSNACLPIPPAPPTTTPTGMNTATFLPSETPSLTPYSTETTLPSFTPSPTLTETGTATPISTSTSTSTSTVTPNPPTSPVPLTFPSLDDWDAGTLAFSHGAEGEWDYILWGGFANSLIRKGNTYYLYYQGSSSYDDTCESVSQRSIGVATSTDGINWTKSAKNPVITWSSQGSIEEGAVSSAAWLGADGKIYVYYGANTGSECTVNANARLAVSEDGETFQDAGEVLSAMDPNVWGSGDEIFPIGVFSHNNNWNLYYTPNGVPLSRQLGVAIGSAPNTFAQSMGLNDMGISIPAWGPVSIAVDGENSILVTNPEGPSGLLNFYSFETDTPSLVKFQSSYVVPNCAQASLLYTADTHHWMMSCRDQNAENYFIRNAYTP